MRIVDCFPYFNEKELLELRINLLYDKVDQFIICDANKTHSGNDKEFTCKKTLKELNLLNDKIQVIEVELPSYEEEKNAWVRERMQRNAAANFITDDDICIVSDCDEIINPNFIDYYVGIIRQHPNNILRIPMAFLNGRADLRVYDSNNQPMNWAASFMCMKHHLEKYTLSDIRESYALSTHHIEFTDIFAVDNEKVEDAGWHFGWMGDMDRLKIKNESFLHWNEVSVQENYVPQENSADCLGRSNHILKKYPTQNLPQKIWELPKVKEFLFVEYRKKFQKIDLLPKKISIIQVGTNRANDSLSNHLLSKFNHLKLGVFVEPNSSFNEDIKKCYSKFHNIFIENVAIVPQEQKEIMMYYHTGDPTYETTSCKLDHILKHQHCYAEGEVKTFTVPCLTLKELFSKYEVQQLDWLLLDIEGIDSEIILSFDWENYDIKRVEFEYLHLGEYKDTIEQKFYDLGYKKVSSLHEFDWAFEK